MLEVQRFTSGAVTLEYIQKGVQPRWLIHTGTHGNEAGVIGSVRKFLTDHWNELPDFLWVIAVSPSAVRLGTRENQYSNDLNRMFFDGTIDEEARANLAFLRHRTFDLLIPVHEDLERKQEFYIYDSASERTDLQEFFARLRSRGINAFTGIDDPSDPILGSYIKDGYHSLMEESGSGEARENDGTAFEYLARCGFITGRRLNPEIPGQADQPTKDFIVSVFFEYLLDWWHRSQA